MQRAKSAVGRAALPCYVSRPSQPPSQPSHGPLICPLSAPTAYPALFSGFNSYLFAPPPLLLFFLLPFFFLPPRNLPLYPPLVRCSLTVTEGVQQGEVDAVLKGHTSNQQGGDVTASQGVMETSVDEALNITERRVGVHLVTGKTEDTRGDL